MILNNMTLPVGYTEDDLKRAVRKASGNKKLKINSIRILKRSIDARKKPKVFYVVSAAVNEEPEILRIPRVTDDMHVTVTGSGPGGLFCALVLAKAGASVTLLERGASVDERTEKVQHFWETGELDPETNVQFGEGGAGTFSDGKLNTLIKDRKHYGAFVLDTFCRHGADESILYDAKPHIGTDVLKSVIRSMREEMISLGVKVRFESKLEDLDITDGHLTGITVNGHKEPCDCLVLATGHSARDTYEMLEKAGLHMEQKAFAVGVRIEHEQEMITLSQYGTLDYEELGAAPYKLTHRASSGRGVYTFCMCPGGYVVNASSEEGRLAINGMSYHARASEHANSGLVVQISPEDFPGQEPLDGMRFQRELEEKAFSACGGKIPVQSYEAFRDGRKEEKLSGMQPVMKGAYGTADLNQILPEEVLKALKEAIPAFGRKIKGFDREDAVLSAVESRTSSPVRIVRDEGREASVRGIFPVGEGAGYAGGITSAAIDGIETAMTLIERSLHG